MLRDFQPLLGATLVVARGATVSNLYQRVQEELPERTSIDAVVVMVGTNDVSNGVGLKKFEEDTATLARKLKALNGRCWIFFISIVPRPCDRRQVVEGYNRIIKKLSYQNRISVINAHRRFSDTKGNPLSRLFKDGVHVNERGAALLRDMTASFVNDRSLAALLKC